MAKFNKPKIVPITRLNKFFSEEDFELEQEFSEEVIESDGNFTVILYKVNRELTSFDSTYGEADEDNIRFYPPVELKVVPIIEEAENKTYEKSSGGLRYLQDGKFTFSIMKKQLDKLKIVLDYGDYIGYPISETEIRFFSIVNNGIKNHDNKHTIMGYKGFYYTVTCSVVDGNEFKAL